MTPFIVRNSVFIHAPIERCFLLSTSIEIVRLELGMAPVEGRTTGLAQSGDTIRWEGTKFGLWQYHVSLISAFEPYRYFQDTMIAGRFASFQHDHWLESKAEGTLLRDEIRFSLPFGPLGWLAGRAILLPHIRKLLNKRFRFLKYLAEGQEWWKYIPRANFL